MPNHDSKQPMYASCKVAFRSRGPWYVGCNGALMHALQGRLLVYPAEVAGDPFQPPLAEQRRAAGAYP